MWETYLSIILNLTVDKVDDERCFCGGNSIYKYGSRQACCTHEKAMWKHKIWESTDASKREPIWSMVDNLVSLRSRRLYFLYIFYATVQTSFVPMQFLVATTKRKRFSETNKKTDFFQSTSFLSSMRQQYPVR